MSDWQTDLRNTLEGLTQEMEAIALEASREAIDMLDRIVAFSDEFMMDMTTSFTTEIETPTPITEFLDRDLEELLNSLLCPFVDLSTTGLSAPETPIAQPHPLCAKCDHYHGQIYGGTPLVCGMHPYGIEEGQDNCADHTSTSVETHSETHHPNLSPDRPNFPPDWWNS